MLASALSRLCEDGVWPSVVLQVGPIDQYRLSSSEQAVWRGSNHSIVPVDCIPTRFALALIIGPRAV